MSVQHSFGLDELRASHENGSFLTLGPSTVEEAEYLNDEWPPHMNPTRRLRVQIPTAVQASFTTGQGSDHTNTVRMYVPLRDEVIEEITKKCIDNLRSTSTEDLESVWDNCKTDQRLAVPAIATMTQDSLEAVFQEQQQNVPSASHYSVTATDWVDTVQQLYESPSEESQTVCTVRRADDSDTGPIEEFSLMSIPPNVTESHDGKHVLVDVVWDRSNYIRGPPEAGDIDVVPYTFTR